MAGSPAVSLTPATLPAPYKPTTTSPTEPALTWLTRFNAILTAPEPPNATSLATVFTSLSYWRDHFCLSWDAPHTFHTPSGIASFLQSSAQAGRVPRVTSITASTGHEATFGAIDFNGEVPCIRLWLNVTTASGNGRGLASLVQESDGEWRAFLLFTTLTGLHGFEERIGTNRPTGVQHGSIKERKNWSDRRREEKEFVKDEQPVVLVVGAGQAGLATAARLKMLGVRTLVIDRNERVGDNWRKRYHQLVLHDPVYFDHLPYMSFPATWPLWAPKDKLADWLETYANTLELDVWTSTTIDPHPTYDPATSTWTVTLTRLNAAGSGTATNRTLHPRHIVMATGHSGEASMPSVPGMETFQGRLCHSSAFDEAKTLAAGVKKRALVIGSCNSGHDIAQEYYENGWDVTMVQRSSTLVVTSESGNGTLLKGLYEENGPPIEDADIISNGPIAVAKTNHIELSKEIRRLDKDRLEGLKKVGFKLDNGPHEAGHFIKYLEKGGGYYIDVGCSELLSSGAISLIQGYQPTSITPTAVVLSPVVAGSASPPITFEADEVIFATGYGSMVSTATKILGKKNTENMQEVWGLDEEGELRGVWRRSGVKGLWAVGGNLGFARYYSRLFALQIKALEEGITNWEDSK